MTTPFPAGAPSAACFLEKRPPILPRLDLRLDALRERNLCPLAELRRGGKSCLTAKYKRNALNLAAETPNLRLKVWLPRAVFASVLLTLAFSSRVSRDANCPSKSTQLT